MSTNQATTELLELARELQPRVNSFMVTGRDGTQRPLGNLEMYALCKLREREWQERRDRDGCCCEEGPYDTGRCRHLGGKCALFEDAERILWRSENEYRIIET